MGPRAAVVAILIHGVGNQPEDWSKEFRSALQAELGADATSVRLLDAYWAPLSKSGDLFRASRATDSALSAATRIEADTYQRVKEEFARTLAEEAGEPSRVRASGPGDILSWAEGTLGGLYQAVEDVGNYVARNGVRTAVQNVLHAKLGEAHAEFPGAKVMVVSHSQGTVVSYDVLRQAGSNYQRLSTWITMGSPLGKYFGLFQWGSQKIGVPAEMRWLNLYDRQDIVGKGLADVVTWQSPRPEDREVDNRHHAKDAHDHWGNPQVVTAVAAEIRRLLAAR